MDLKSIVYRLNDQINLEFYAANLCLNLSHWCSECNLTGTSTFLLTQAQDNLTQMMSLFDYAKRIGAIPSIGIIDIQCEKPDSLDELFQTVVDNYENRDGMLLQLTHEAKILNDTSMLDFLHNLKKKQRQEGLLLRTLLEEVRNAKCAGLSALQIDQNILNIVEYMHR